MADRVVHEFTDPWDLLGKLTTFLDVNEPIEAYEDEKARLSGFATSKALWLISDQNLWDQKEVPKELTQGDTRLHLAAMYALGLMRTHQGRESLIGCLRDAKQIPTQERPTIMDILMYEDED